MGAARNAVQVTHWQIPMHVVSTITGGLTLDVTVTLHLRADVRGHRMTPSGPRGGLNRLFLGLATTVESRADYVASGEIAQTDDASVLTTITLERRRRRGQLDLARRTWSSAGGVLDWTTLRTRGCSRSG